jgi:hypothetical protein
MWAWASGDAKCFNEVGRALNAATVEHWNKYLTKAYLDLTPIGLRGEVLKLRKLGPARVQSLHKRFEVCIASDGHPALAFMRKPQQNTPSKDVLYGASSVGWPKFGNT